MKAITPIILLLISFSLSANSASVIEFDSSASAGTISGVSTNAVENSGCSDGAIDLEILNVYGPFYIEWSNGETSESISNLPPGEYCVVVTDSQCGEARGCWEIKCCPFLFDDSQIDFNITHPACTNQESELELILSSDDIEGSALSIYLDNTTDHTSYEFDITTNISTFTDLSVGEYTAQINYGEECSYSFEFEIVLKPIEIQFEKSSDCGAGGSIDVIALNGKGEYTYEWTDDPSINSPIRENLSSTFYTVKVVDENNCEASASTYVKAGTDFDPESILTSYSNPNCQTNNGIIKILNYNDYGIVAFEWSNGETEFKIYNLYAGDYSVTLWNDEGCSHDLEFKLEDKGTPSIGQVIIESSCESPSTGLIGVIAYSSTGDGLKYLWDTGSEEQIIDNLAPGEYCVTITDNGNECYITECYTIEEIEAEISLSGNIVNNCSSSANAPTGSIQNLTSGGTKPYSYIWSNGYSGSNPQNLAAGTYTITVSDQCGETASISYTVIDYKVEIELSADLDQGVTTITANPSGESPFEYEWSTGDESSSINVTENGEYTVTVTDDTGCGSIESIFIDNDCPNLVINLNTLSPDISCGGASQITFDAPVSGTYPMILTITLDGEVVENTILESNSDVLNYEFYNQTNSGDYKIYVIDNCGNEFNETWASCLTCTYESGIDGDNPYVSLFKNYITLSQECPCDNDCGFLGFTTDKIKLDVDKSGLLNDPSFPYGYTFKIIWPNGEITSIYKFNSTSSGEEIKINGKEEYKLTDDDYEGEDNDEDTGGTVEVTVQFNWDGELDCETTIPFTFGELGFNGYFNKYAPSNFNPFPEFDIFNVGTIACETKCSVPLVTGELYINEPIDGDDQESEYASKCGQAGDNAIWDPTLSWFRYLPNSYSDPCYGGGVLESYFESPNGLIKGLRYIAAGVALGEKETPYPLFSSFFNSSSQYSCPDFETDKGYCLFDALDVYGISLNDKLLVEYCEESYFDPPIDTDEDGIPDIDDPCPFDPDVFCDPNNPGGGGPGTGGGGSHPDGCKVTFPDDTDECKIITYCPEETPVTQTGTITFQNFGGSEPCLHCFSANICNVTDVNTGQQFTRLIGAINQNILITQTTTGNSDNCEDECILTYLCQGQIIGTECGTCGINSNPSCSYSQLVNIIENSYTSEDGSSSFVRQGKRNNNFSFEVNPNPSSGSFTIEIFSSQIENQTLIISTSTGDNLYNFTIPVSYGFNSIPLEANLENGIYLLSLISNKEIKTIKHVVHK